MNIIDSRIVLKLTQLFKRPLLRDYVILFAAVLVITVPFVNKAFDWDDREYIEFAQVFKEHPLQFHLENLVYKGEYFDQFRTSHPPLVSEYLALFLRMGLSASEIMLHLAFIIFPLIAAFSMYYLARRFTSHPLPASLLLLATPGFFVSSHSLMGDIPGLALWLASVALFIYGCDRGSWKLLILGGFAMAIASLTAYQALSVIPLLLLYVLLKKRFRLRMFVPFLIPVAVFGIYTWFIHYKYSGWPVMSYHVGLDFGWQDPDLKARAILTFIGGAIIFPFAVIPLFFRKKIDLLVGFLFLPPVITWAAIYYLGEGQLTALQALEVTVLMAAGFAIAYMFFSSTVSGLISWLRGRKGWTDSLFLLVWFAGVAIYIGIFLPFVTARFLLPLFPPVVLLFMREAEKVWPMRARLRSIFIVGTLVLTFALGLAASVADYRFANSYRTIAQDLKEQYASTGKKLWVLDEFGIRYYLQKAGFEYLGPPPPDDRRYAQLGDIVVSSYLEAKGVVGNLPEGSYRILSTIEINDGFPIRIFNEQAGAGFYCHFLGPLPMAISTAPVDEVTVYELYW